MVQPIPEGYEHLTAYIVPRDAAAAIDFYTRHLGFTVLTSMPPAFADVDDEAPGVGARPVDVGGSVVLGELAKDLRQVAALFADLHDLLPVFGPGLPRRAPDDDEGGCAHLNTDRHLRWSGRAGPAPT